MRLEQRLTPQLIQSMAILQKPVADLEAFVNEALESNPALERAENVADESTAVVERPAGTTERPAGADAEGFARLDRYHHSYDFDDDGAMRARRVTGSGERDAKMEAMANTAGREGGLHEYLTDQWMMLELAPETRRAGEVIINQITPEGYFTGRLEDLAADARPPVPFAALERAYEQVRRLDPAGIGARDTVDCLLMQIDRLPGDNRIERTLVEHHLQDIAQNRLPFVAKATGFSLGEISDAIRVLRSTLTLHPGHLVGDRSVPTVRPDVIVDYADTGGGLTVALARGNAPKLKVSDHMLALTQGKADGKAGGKTLRDYARKHVEEASTIIDALQFRQSRLLEVSKAIVERQREFFEIGPQGLRVLRMADLAAELNCDPSTISRAVAEKYMQTPRGVYPLRYFFTGGLETADGQSAGWDRVKNRVKEIVEQEDKKTPLSDDAIAEMLEKEGFEIKRRTVAKYRQQHGIGSTRQRRVFE